MLKKYIPIFSFIIFPFLSVGQIPINTLIPKPALITNILSSQFPVVFFRQHTHVFLYEINSQIQVHSISLTLRKVEHNLRCFPFGITIGFYNADGKLFAKGSSGLINVQNYPELGNNEVSLTINLNNSYQLNPGYYYIGFQALSYNMNDASRLCPNMSMGNATIVCYQVTSPESQIKNRIFRINSSGQVDIPPTIPKVTSSVPHFTRNNPLDTWVWDDVSAFPVITLN